MIATFLAISVLTLGAAVAAMTSRNLIHSALLLVVSWVGVACFYLWAGAEFVAFAQVLVYVGAISMVVLFAVLLTRKGILDTKLAPTARNRVVAAVVAGLGVAATLGFAILNTPFATASSAAPALTVRALGEQLTGRHAGGLLLVGVMLTVTLLGAVVIASPEKEPADRSRP